MQGHRHYQDEERRPRHSREVTDTGGEPERSWRDQGDGGYYEPSRGRWDDDRRYTGSRQDPPRNVFETSQAAPGYELGDPGDNVSESHGFTGSYGRGTGPLQPELWAERVSGGDDSDDRSDSGATNRAGARNKPKSGSRLP